MVSIESRASNRYAGGASLRSSLFEDAEVRFAAGSDRRRFDDEAKLGVLREIGQVDAVIGRAGELALPRDEGADGGVGDAPADGVAVGWEATAGLVVHPDVGRDEFPIAKALRREVCDGAADERRFGRFAQRMAKGVDGEEDERGDCGGH